MALTLLALPTGDVLTSADGYALGFDPAFAVEPWPAGTTYGYAAAFIAAAGITDPGQQQQLQQREAALLEAQLLNPAGPSGSALLADYPFIGGTAARHRLNFVDPATFPLTFVNGAAHTATGTQFNGANQYAATGIYPAQHQAADSHALGVHLRGLANNAYLCGLRQGNNYYSLYQNATTFFYGINGQEATMPQTGAGFRAISRLAGTSTFVALGQQVNGIQNANAGLLPLEIYLAGLNNEGGGAVLLAAAEVVGFFVGRRGLDASQLQAYEAMSTAFQTALGR